VQQTSAEPVRARPTTVYADALREASVSSTAHSFWSIRYADGRYGRLPLDRWCGAADAEDRELVARCSGATLDVGCGPGRLLAALRARGNPALGIDVTAAAVRLARRWGSPVLQRSVFDRLPHEGHWSTLLLADGNVGIGGDVRALLHRCAALVTVDGGRVLVELDPPGHASGPCRVRLESRHAASSWFPWAHLSVDRLAAASAGTDLHVESMWASSGRWFASLRR